MKAIIVEDEFPAREELKYFIKNFSKIEILNELILEFGIISFWIMGNYIYCLKNSMAEEPAGQNPWHLKELDMMNN